MSNEKGKRLGEQVTTVDILTDKYLIVQISDNEYYRYLNFSMEGMSSRDIQLVIMKLFNNVKRNAPLEVFEEFRDNMVKEVDQLVKFPKELMDRYKDIPTKKRMEELIEANGERWQKEAEERNSKQ